MEQDGKLTAARLGMAVPVIPLLDCVVYFREVLEENRRIESARQSEDTPDIFEENPDYSGADDSDPPVDVELNMVNPELSDDPWRVQQPIGTNPDGHYYTVKEEPVTDHLHLFDSTHHSPHFTTSYLLPYAADPNVKFEPMHYFTSTHVPGQFGESYYALPCAHQEVDSQSVVSAESFAEERTDELFPDFNCEISDVIDASGGISPPARYVPASGDAAVATVVHEEVLKDKSRLKGRPAKRKASISDEGDGGADDALRGRKKVLSLPMNERGKIGPVGSKKDAAPDVRTETYRTRARLSTGIAAPAQSKDPAVQKSKKVSKPDEATAVGLSFRRSLNDKNVNKGANISNDKRATKVLALKAKSAQEPAVALGQQYDNKGRQKKPLYPCLLCSNTYYHPSSVERHVKDKHNDIAPSAAITVERAKDDAKHSETGGGAAPVDAGLSNREAATNNFSDKNNARTFKDKDNAVGALNDKDNAADNFSDIDVVDDFSDRDDAADVFSDEDAGEINAETDWSDVEPAAELNSKTDINDKSSSISSNVADCVGLPLPATKVMLESLPAQKPATRKSTSKVVLARKRPTTAVKKRKHSDSTVKVKGARRFCYYCNECGAGLLSQRAMMAHQCYPLTTANLYTTRYFSEIEHVMTSHQCVVCGVWTLKGEQTRAHSATCKVASYEKEVTTADLKNDTGTESASAELTPVTKSADTGQEVGLKYDTCAVCKLYSCPSMRLLALHIAVNHQSRNDDGGTECPLCSATVGDSLFKHILEDCEKLSGARDSLPNLRVEQEECTQNLFDDRKTCKWCQLRFCDVQTRVNHQTMLGCDQIEHTPSSEPIDGQRKRLPRRSKRAAFDALSQLQYQDSPTTDGPTTDSPSTDSPTEHSPTKHSPINKKNFKKIVTAPQKKVLPLRPLPRPQEVAKPRRAKHVCKMCKLPFTDLFKHSVLQHMNKVGQFFCSECSYTSVSYDNLQNHYNVKHAEGRPSCPKCYRKFSHVSSIHSHFCKMRKCPMCEDFSTPSKYQLCVHIAVAHVQSSNIEVTECAFCGSSLNSVTVFHHLLNCCAKMAGEGLVVAGNASHLAVLVSKKEMERTGDVMACIEKLVLDVEKKVVPESRIKHSSVVVPVQTFNEEATRWCSGCGTACMSTTLLRQHKQSDECKEVSAALLHIESENTVQCSTCHQVFLHPQLLKQHLQDIGSVWRCAECILWFRESDKSAHADCQGLTEAVDGMNSLGNACGICRLYSSNDPCQMAHHIAQTHSNTDVLSVYYVGEHSFQQNNEPLEQSSAVPELVEGRIQVPMNDMPATGSRRTSVTTHSNTEVLSVDNVGEHSFQQNNEPLEQSSAVPELVEDGIQVPMNDMPATTSRKWRKSAANARAKITVTLSSSDSGGGDDTDADSTYSTEADAEDEDEENENDRKCSTPNPSPVKSAWTAPSCSAPSRSTTVQSSRKSNLNAGFHCFTCERCFTSSEKLKQHAEGEHVYKCEVCASWLLGYSAHHIHLKQCKDTKQPASEDSQQGSLPQTDSTVQPQTKLNQATEGCQLVVNPNRADGGQDEVSHQGTDLNGADGRALVWSSASQCAEPSTVPGFLKSFLTSSSTTHVSVSSENGPSSAAVQQTNIAVEDLINQIAEAKLTRKTCPICKEKLENWQAVDRHIAVDHQLQCDNCNSSFKYVKPLIAHINICKGKLFAPTVKCPICKVYTLIKGKDRNISFKLSDHLQLNHMEKYDDGRQRCPICQRTLSEKKTLLMHLNMESCDRPPPCLPENDITSPPMQYPDSDPFLSNRRKAWFDHGRPAGATKVMPAAVKTMYIEKAGFILPPRPCHICNEGVFKFATAYRSHILKEHKFNLSQKKVYCTNCLKVMGDGETLLDHQKSNTCITTFYPCDRCDVICQSELALRKHNNLKHLSESEWLPCCICIVCGLFFFNKRSLYIHKQAHERKSADGIQLQCIVCNEAFPNRKLRALHERDVHFKELKCQFDGCNWQSKGTFASGRWSQFRLTYRSHVQECHNVSLKVFECTFGCSEVFKSKKQHDAHVLAVHKIKRVRKCADCSYESTNLNSYAAHRQAYHSDQLQACKLCPFTCRWNNSLIRHIKTIHSSQEKKFKCEVCDMRFTQGGSVKRHMRTAHSDNR